MKDENNKIVFLFKYFFAWLLGCVGSSSDIKLNGGYYLSSLDTKDNMEITYKDEQDYMFSIINATVFAVGQNKDFIIAKQYPSKFPNKGDKTFINFFIIPLKHKTAKSIEKNLFGPLTFKEFEEKKKELNIESLDFTIVLKDLE